MPRVPTARGRGARLRKTWLGGALIDRVTLTTTQGSLGAVQITETALLESTVLRVRGELLIVAIPNAAADSDVVGLGLVVVSAAAIAAAGAALPGPINDIGSDSWMWYQTIPLDAVVLTAGDANARAVIHRVTIDAKAMRKLPQDNALVLVGELSTGDFASVNVTGQMRVLIGT